jgi:predicted DNA-binding transcriptional regulator YafY
MNRIDRLFAILLILQRKKRVRAYDLATTFEVSERTIYRDMTALSESGVPLVALPGAGYELTEGYYLPPLLFTPQEAQALALGAQLVRAHAQGQLGDDAKQALDKILVRLPAAAREQVALLTDVVQFYAPHARLQLDDERLLLLQQAVREQRVVRLSYHSYNRNETSNRDVEPRRLTYAEGRWYLSGYCRLRADERDFRLERIEALQLLEQWFTPRPAPPTAHSLILVRIRFADEVVRWVRERQHFGFQCELPATDAPHVVMQYAVEQLSEMIPWVLSWGAAAVVLEPPELRAALRRQVEGMQAHLT